MANAILYGVTLLLLAVSFWRDRNKTRMALLKAWRSFDNILPQFLGVIILIGLLLAIFTPDMVARFIGTESGWKGVILSALAGSVTLMPPYISFPMAAMLLENGAGYMQIAAFISTLMMVGVATAPIEMRFFGKRLTVLRNSSAFVFSFIVAYIVGKVVGGL